MVRVFPAAPTTSTISSRAVSGSITTVKVELVDRELGSTPPSSEEAALTTIDSAPAVTELVSVVC